MKPSDKCLDKVTQEAFEVPVRNDIPDMLLALNTNCIGCYYHQQKNQKSYCVNQDIVKLFMMQQYGGTR